MKSISLPRKYYWHGDAYDDEPAKYYCAACDMFIEPEHLTKKFSDPWILARHEEATRWAAANRHKPRRP